MADPGDGERPAPVPEEVGPSPGEPRAGGGPAAAAAQVSPASIHPLFWPLWKALQGKPGRDKESFFWLGLFAGINYLR